jgi:TMEM175 potassium channel family protein
MTRTVAEAGRRHTLYAIETSRPEGPQQLDRGGPGAQDPADLRGCAPPRLGVHVRPTREPPPQPRPVQLSDTQRTETFSDGVFAIAITLLVLNLATPHHPPGQLLDFLIRQWPAYLAYCTSFLFIGVIWFNHHQVFTRIRYVDRGVHVGNLAILFTTAVLPFPTEVVATAVQEGDPFDARIAVAFYAIAAALMCSSWLLLFWHVARREHLIHEEVDSAFFEYEQIRAAVGVGLYLGAGVAGWLITPVLALAVFTLLPIFYWSTSEGMSDVPPRLRRMLSR